MEKQNWNEMLSIDVFVVQRPDNWKNTGNLNVQLSGLRP